MPSFSEELQRLIRERDIKIYVLAAASGIDRTLIHKILKGDRIPTNRAVVQKLASVLLLTPQETENLMQSYQLTKMGKDSYSRHKKIEDLFHDFHSISQPNHIIFKTDYRPQMNALPDEGAAYGSLEVNSLIKTVIEMEAAKDSGRVRVIAQPEYAFLFNFLALTGMNRHNMAVDQIICMENTLVKKDSLYNLNCFSAVMPIALSGCEYKPMCYYDDATAHISSTSILPYMILTGSYVVNISYDISYATISGAQPYLALYSRVFEDLAERSIPMLTITPGNQMEQFLASASTYGNISFYFSNDPQLIPFMPEKILNKYLNPNASMNKNAAVPKQILSAKGQIKTICFTEAGLNRFLSTGILSKRYQEFFFPLELTDRYVLLKKIYDMALSGNYHPALINSAIFHIPEYLSVLVFHNAVSFFLTLPGNESSICTIEEKSLVYAFRDFFKYLPENNSVLSEEESLSILKRKLDQAPAN